MKCQNSIQKSWSKWLMIGLLFVGTVKELPAQMLPAHYDDLDFGSSLMELKVDWTQKAQNVLSYLIFPSNEEAIETSLLRYNLFLLQENIRVCQKITVTRESSQVEPQTIKTESVPTSPEMENERPDPTLKKRVKQQMNNKHSKPKGIWNRPGNRKISI